MDKENINEKDSTFNKIKDKVVTTIDTNGDGNIDIEDIIILGLKTPGIRIDRADFLTKEFSKKYSEEIVKKAIETTPLNANIPLDEINIVADNIIAFNIMVIC